MSALGVLALSLVPHVATARDQATLAAQADHVRATAAEMNYTRIPWVTDLFAGFRMANAEKRPVFLYLITGDPLDDC